MMDTRLEKAKNGLVNSVGFIVVFAVVVIYIAKSFVEISATGKTVTEIIADGILALIFGWAIKMILGYQGILTGMSLKSYKDTQESHAQAVTQAEPYLPQLASFCDRENAALRIKKRRLILSKKLLNYDDVFCDNPAVLDEVINKRMEMIRGDVRIDANDLKSKIANFKLKHAREKERKEILKCVRKANNVHFDELTAQKLTTDGGREENPFRFAEPLTKRMGKKAVSSLPMAIVFAVVFGYYGYQMIENPSWATIIGGLIQVGSYLIVGTLQFIKELLYVTDTYRKSIVRKIDIIDRFVAEAKENLQKDKQFEIPVEIAHRLPQKREDLNEQESIRLFEEGACDTAHKSTN